MTATGEGDLKGDHIQRPNSKGPRVLKVRCQTRLCPLRATTAKGQKPRLRPEANVCRLRTKSQFHPFLRRGLAWGAVIVHQCVEGNQRTL